MENQSELEKYSQLCSLYKEQSVIQNKKIQWQAEQIANLSALLEAQAKIISLQEQKIEELSPKIKPRLRLVTNEE